MKRNNGRLLVSMLVMLAAAACPLVAPLAADYNQTDQTGFGFDPVFQTTDTYSAGASANTAAQTTQQAGSGTTTTTAAGANTSVNLPQNAGSGTTIGKDLNMSLGSAYNPAATAGTDYTGAYKFGGTLSAPPGTNDGGEKTILDANVGIDAGAVLGCSGVDLTSAIRSNMGIGSTTDLAQQAADYAKSKVFQKSLSMLYATPGVANVLDGLQAIANAKVSLLQQKCDAAEVYADVQNKQLRAEAMHKCVEEKGSMEECQKSEVWQQYVKKAVDSPKWNKDLYTQLCEGAGADKEGAGCEWRFMLPNKKTKIDPEAETEKNPTTGEETPDQTDAVVLPEDVVDMASSTAAELLVDRLKLAEDAVRNLGYNETMRRALSLTIGDSSDTSSTAAASDSAASQKEDYQVYNLGEFTQGQACTASLEYNPAFEQAALNSVFDPSSVAKPQANKVPDGAEVAPPPPTTGSDAQAAPETSAPTTSNASTSGRVFPIAGADADPDNVTSPFGMRVHPLTHTSKFHKGVDLSASAGRQLVAVMDGIVTRKNTQPASGNTVWITSGNVKVKYFHLASFASNLREGMPIRAGTPIGIMGNTGHTTGHINSAGVKVGGVHLHFELWVNGQVADPWPWLGGSDTVEIAERAISQPDAHGDVSLVSQRTTLPPDDPFVLEMQNQITKLGARIVSTASCMINSRIHPQVYVGMALLPGSVNLDADRVIEKDTGGGDASSSTSSSALQEIADASSGLSGSGDKFGMVLKLSQMVGYDAAIITYGAVIRDMAIALAKKGTDGDDAMNEPLYNFGREQMCLLDTQREAIMSNYTAACNMAETIAAATSQDPTKRVTFKSRCDKYSKNRARRMRQHQDLCAMLAVQPVSDQAAAQQTNQTAGKTAVPAGSGGQ